MTTESRRHDLYNGLTEVLGQERADTLMSHLPTHQYDDLATKRDIDALSDRIDEVESSLITRIDNVESSLITRIDNVESMLSARIDNLGTRSDSLRSEMVQGFDAVNSRIDRLMLTMAAGLLAIIATMVAQSIF